MKKGVIQMPENKLAKEFNLIGLLKFTMPTTIMMVFMALYQMVDGVFVSNFVGHEALSAINIAYPAISVVIAISIMLSTGGSAIIARYMGEGRPHEARQSFSLICAAGLCIGLLLTVLGLIFLDPLVRALGATDAIYGYCRDYLFVLILGCPLAVFQMLFQGFFVTAGKPNLGLTVTVIGGLCNVLLDYLFVGILPLGVLGAGIATVIGYSVPAVFGLFYFALKRKGSLYLVRPKLQWRILLQACGNGSSEMVSNVATAVTTYLFNILMLNLMGEKGVAAITIILYAQFMLTAVFIGFSMGVAPVFSFSYGSNNRKRTAKLFKKSMGLIAVCSALAFTVAAIFAPQIVGIFSREGTEVYSIAIKGFGIFSFSFIFAGLNIFASALFTAFSNGPVSAIISFSRTFIVLVACLLILPKFLGVTGIWLAVPLAELISAAVSLIYIVKYSKRYGLTQSGKEVHKIA